MLQENLCKRSPLPTSFLRFLVVMSPAEIHSHPVSSTVVSQSLHPKLKEEVKRLVNENVTSVQTVKASLCSLVENMFDETKLPRPDEENRCFYPTDKMIRNHIQLTQYELKKSRFDERDLGNCVKFWIDKYPEDRIFFRPGKCSSATDTDDTNECTVLNESTIMFCHQTKWQMDLLSRYGNYISLLDPAFKTTKYSLPLFFIMVKTNCGYSIVGTFVVYEETRILISEALSIFASWNPEWDPKYFMTNFSEVEIDAVKEIFPTSTIYLCVFHREQTWDRWLQKGGRIFTGGEQIIKKLWRDVATSISEEEYQANLEVMNTNEVYKQCPLAKNYFAQKWLGCLERWVLAYHTAEFLSTLNINNGMETQKKILKHSFLRYSSNKTVPGILRIIIEEFLPESLKSYCVSNVTFNSTVGDFGNETPAFLHDKTESFITHFKNESNKALKNYDIDKIIDMSGADNEGLFYVKSESEECYYIVNFEMATCSCSHFTKWQFPCKHMCALFVYTDWSFDKLPIEYKESPYITVDNKYSSIVVEVQNCELKVVNVSKSKDYIETDLTSLTDKSKIVVEEVKSRSSPKCSASIEDVPSISDIRPPVSVDLLEAREKLKRILSYTYRMDSTYPFAQEFCEQVNNLEVKTLKNLQQLENVMIVQPVVKRTNIKMPPLQLLRKKYTELPNWRKNPEGLKAIGRVLSMSNDSSPHGLCYELDMTLPIDASLSPIEIELPVCGNA